MGKGEGKGGGGAWAGDEKAYIPLWGNGNEGTIVIVELRRCIEWGAQCVRVWGMNLSNWGRERKVVNGWMVGCEGEYRPSYEAGSGARSRKADGEVLRGGGDGWVAVRICRARGRDVVAAIQPGLFNPILWTERAVVKGTVNTEDGACEGQCH